MRKQRSSNRIVVDSRGIWCPPTPLTDLFKAWRKADIGDEIELWATEPSVEKDVRAWAKKSGNRVVEAVKEKDFAKVVVEVTKKGKEVASMSAFKVNIGEPDETKTAPKMKLQLVTVGGFTLGLRTLEPGWKWTTSMRSIAKTETCEIRHIGYIFSGRMGFLMNDGAEFEVGPGDVFDVQPGHDAWTIGNAPVVFIDLISATEQERTSATRNAEPTS
jgi:TusA-related sulfurtransferase